MQRKAMVALVAGASVGVGAGALGAFVAWAAAGAVARRFPDQFSDQDDQDIELEQPAPSATWHGTQQASSGSTPVTSPASDLSLPTPKEAVTSAQAP
jgi:hypothetical protein